MAAPSKAGKTCGGYTSLASRTWSTCAANDVGRNSAASTNFGCHSLMIRSRVRIGSTAVHSTSTNDQSCNLTPSCLCFVTTESAGAHPSHISYCGRTDSVSPKPRAPCSKPDHRPALSQRTGGLAKTFDHCTNFSRSSRASAHNSKREPLNSAFTCMTN